jgi:hypothetical protein
MKIRHQLRAAVAVVGIVGMLGAGPTAIAHEQAHEPRVAAARGTCSDDSHWALKLTQYHRRILVAFRVKSGIVGEVWQVKILHNRRVMFADIRKTQEPDGAFVVRRPARNTRGTDFFKALARNPSTGETCKARLAI